MLERTRDEMGDWRLCLLSPWGGRVHAPWTMALEAKLRQAGEQELETIWSDDGIVIRLPERERPPAAGELLPEPEEIEDLVVRELGGTSLFAARFREAAARALLLPRRRPGQRTPLWMQRKRAHDLLQVASRYASFPIVLEAYRECLQDVFDLPGLVELARRVRQREIRLVTVDTQTPSPFSASLLFGYVANYLYDGDAPLAERRAQALSVDQSQLRELLGASELRELLDERLLGELELQLQALEGSQRATSPDRLHDLLLRLGDLSFDEIAARIDPALGEREARAREWLDALAARAPRHPGRDRGRAALRRGRGRRQAARRARCRASPGPARGLPRAGPARAAGRGASLRADARARSRRARLARRFGMGESAVLDALAGLVREGRVLEGEFRPGGTGREWCAPDVLATLRRRSFAALRKQVEPAEPAALARLLLDWQGVALTGETVSAAVRRGPDALLDVVEQLQGAAFPASILERDVLPARIPGYRPEDLDTLCAAGEVVWVGLGPLGERDGRLALYLTRRPAAAAARARRAAAGRAPRPASASTWSTTARPSSASCSKPPAAASRARSWTRSGTSRGPAS